MGQPIGRLGRINNGLFVGTEKDAQKEAVSYDGGEVGSARGRPRDPGGRGPRTDNGGRITNGIYDDGRVDDV